MDQNLTVSNNSKLTFDTIKIALDSSFDVRWS